MAFSLFLKNREKKILAVLGHHSSHQSYYKFLQEPYNLITRTCSKLVPTSI